MLTSGLTKKCSIIINVSLYSPELYFLLPFEMSVAILCHNVGLQASSLKNDSSMAASVMMFRGSLK